MVCVEQPLASHGSAKYYGCFQLISKIQFVFPTTVSMTRWYNGMDVNKFKFYFVSAEVINKTHAAVGRFTLTIVLKTTVETLL